MESQNTLDLRRLVALCRRHFWVLVISTLGLALVGWAFAEFALTPQYTATAQILVNQKHDTDNGQYFNEQQADIQMINTYKDIITNQVILSRTTKELANPMRVVKKAQPAKYVRQFDGTKKLVKKAQPAVVERYGRSYSYSVKGLQKAITITTQQNSQVFAVNAKTNDPDKSKAVANTVAKVFKSRIKSIMNVNNVTIVSPASTPKERSFPKTKLFVLAGAVLGLLISLAVILLRDLFDTTVRDDTFLADELKLTNLGQVSHIHLSNSFKVPEKSTPSRRRV